MSKDLTISAKSYYDQVNTNQIGYKNESIGDSILPHLVKRARLNPTVVTNVKTQETIDEDGETVTEEVEEQTIEMRHYYSLHNDASKAIHVSPTIRLENTLPGGVHTDIPNKPDEIPESDVLNPPDDPYIPIDPDNPNPIPGPSLPPGELIIPPILPPSNTIEPEGPGIYYPPVSPIVPPNPPSPPVEPGKNPPWTPGPSPNGPKPTINLENLILSSTIIGRFNSTNDGTPPGNGGGSWGGGFSTNNNTGHNSTNHKTKALMTDFDNYAEWVVGLGDDLPSGVIDGDTSSVVRWYHNRSKMETAKNAMKNTRSPYRSSGWRISERYAKLLTADSMYEGSHVSEVTLEIPEVTAAPRMFADTPNLKTLKIKKADSLIDASEFCKGSSAKIVSISDAKSLDNITDAFADCNNLRTLTISNANTLQSINVSSLPKLSTVTISGSFSGTLSNVFKNCPLLLEVNLSLKNTTGLSDIFDESTRFGPERIKINGKKLTSFGNTFSLCSNLVAADITTGPSFVVAKELFTGLERLESVKCKFKGTTNMEAICKDCIGLRKVDIINDFAPATVEEGSSQGGGINGDEAFCNCRVLQSIPQISYYFKSAKKTFLQCDGFVSFSGEKPFEFTNGEQFLWRCKYLQTVNISCPHAENLNYSFESCSYLRNANIMAPAATDCKNMFNNCHRLVSVSGDFSSLKDADLMFRQCNSLKTIPDISSVTNIRGAFISTSITEVPHMPNIITAHQAFRDCLKLTSVDCSPWTKLTDASWMFWGCTGITSVTLELSNPNINLAGMFSGCPIKTLTSVKLPAGISIGGDVFANSRLDMASFEKLYNALKEINFNNPNAVFGVSTVTFFAVKKKYASVYVAGTNETMLAVSYNDTITSGAGTYIVIKNNG